MLRFDFMASDFNEHFLVLGDVAELAEFATELRRFARDLAPLDLSARFPNPATTASLVLLPADGAQQGLHRLDDHVFQWSLQGWQAGAIADGIDKINAERSGSDIFQLGAEGEIPMKVSHGEFTDDFLVSKH